MLTIAGFAIIGGLSVRRTVLSTGADRALTAAILLLYGGWVTLESRVSVRELDAEAPDHDRGTLEVAALAKIALLVTVALGHKVAAPIQATAGFCALLGGALLRTTAIRKLGAGYTHRLRAPRVPIVSAGPYAWIRHPAYLGTLVAHAGLVLVLPDRWSIAALLVLWTPAVFLRVVVEDRFLRRSPAYAEYAERVRQRLIPLIW